MEYSNLLNEIIKKYDYQSITYQNILVPNGWFVECKLFKKLNGMSYSGFSHDKNVNIATKNAAMLVYNQVIEIHENQSICSGTKRIKKRNYPRKINLLDDPLPIPRQKIIPINEVEYQIKKKLLDEELDEYMKQRKL